MVTRAQGEEECEGVASGEEGVAHEWEALKLQLSRDDVTKGTEIESYIVKDLIIKHKRHIAGLL